MASNSKTLKLKILGDVDNLNKSLKKGSTDLDTFGSKVSRFGKAAAKAFAVAAAAAAAYAAKLAIDGVKAAVADEAAQKKLAVTLQNVTGATNAQIAAIEQNIYQMSLAVGVADDELRPAFERLARATGDIAKSQQLLDLALNISAGTGKSLESVTNALGKAYEGSNTSLGKLGIGIDKAALSSMSFDEITKQLGQTFAGQAASQADTFAGRMQRINVAMAELQEEAGARLLPILEKIINWIIDTGLPAFDKFSTWFSETITPALQDFAKWWDEYITPAIELFVKWVQDRLIPAFKQMVGYIKEDMQPTFDNIARIFKEYEPQIKLFLGALAAVADWVITVGVPVLVVGFFQLIAKVIDAIMKKVEAVLWLMEKLGMGVQETAKTTTKELKNMESGFSEAADITNAKLAASKSGMLGFTDTTKKATETVEEFGATATSSVGSASSAVDKAAAKIEKANDRIEAAWIASMKAAKEAAKAAVAATWEMLKAGNDAIAAIKQKQLDYGQKFEEAITGILSLSDAASDAGADTGKTFMQSLLDQVAKAQAFAGKIKQLIKMGLSQAGIDQIISSGADIGSKIADEILGGGAASVAQVNAAFSALANTGASLAAYASSSVYGAELQAANYALADARIAGALAGNINVGGMAGWEAVLSSGSPEMQASVGPGVIPPNINITVNGALDAEGVARQIVGLINDSAGRTGNYQNIGISALSLAGI